MRQKKTLRHAYNQIRRLPWVFLITVLSYPFSGSVIFSRVVRLGGPLPTPVTAGPARTLEILTP